MPIRVKYSVVSIMHTGGNKQTGWEVFFHLLHEKGDQGGVKTFCFLNRYYSVHK